NPNIFASPNKLLQLGGLDGVQIDKMEAVKGRNDGKCAGGAPLYLLLRSLESVYSSAAEAIDIVFLQRSSALILEGCGIGVAVLFDDIKFQKRPFTYFVGLKWWFGHTSSIQDVTIEVGLLEIHSTLGLLASAPGSLATVRPIA